MNIMTKFIIIPSIIWYQKCISPYKGYCCAHHALNGGDTCSEWGIRAAKKAGFLRFFPLMIRRFKSCKAAYNEIAKITNEVEDKNKDNAENEKEYNPLTDKKNISCCISGFPCCPFV